MPIEAVSRTNPFASYELFGTDDLNVAIGVTLVSTQEDTILAYSGQHRITVAGTIIAFDDCINLLGSVGAQYVEIAATGVLTAGVGSTIVDSDCVYLDGAGKSAQVLLADFTNGTVFVASDIRLY